jgi:hypothetical protein
LGGGDSGSTGDVHGQLVIVDGEGDEGLVGFEDDVAAADGIVQLRVHELQVQRLDDGHLTIELNRFS